MADAYWRYTTDPRQPPAATSAASLVPQPAALKRPRPDYPDMAAGAELVGYSVHRPVRETENIAASYDRYLRNGVATYGVTEPTIRPPVVGGVSSHLVDDRRVAGVVGMDSRSVSYGGARPEPPLPPDASNTLYIEGLPSNCTRREVSHIFRPFVGFREVRLVNKESKHAGADPLVLCFVDFATPAQATVALEALQGYRFDEHDRDSSNLRLQFARFPGPRSSGGSRGRR